MADPDIDIPSAAHEHRDIDERFIWIAMAAMLALIGASAIATYGLYPQTRPGHTHPQPLPLFPSPRLQVDPAADMRRFREAQLRELQSTGWADREHRVRRIPIDQAMREVSRDGIPEWPARH